MFFHTYLSELAASMFLPRFLLSRANLDGEVVLSALATAIDAHTDQHVKNTELPYVLHPIWVAAYVWCNGGTQDTVVAALLHDVVEDCGVSLDEIERKFGAEVRRLVSAVTNPPIVWADHSPEEVQRLLSEFREQYFTRMRSELEDVQLLSAADKYMNAWILQSLLCERSASPSDMLALFNTYRGKSEGTRKYYTRLADLFLTDGKNAAVRAIGLELTRTCMELDRSAGRCST